MKAILMSIKPERCRDNYEGCRYFDTEKYEREEKTESEHDE